jgi:hypothetical protein
MAEEKFYQILNSCENEFEEIEACKQLLEKLKNQGKLLLNNMNEKESINTLNKLNDMCLEFGDGKDKIKYRMYNELRENNLFKIAKEKKEDLNRVKFLLCILFFVLFCFFLLKICNC